MARRTVATHWSNASIPKGLSVPASMRDAISSVVTAALLLLSSVACEDGRDTGPEEVRITNIDTLITLESELLAAPVDLDVVESGSVFVLDAQLARIVVATPEGEPMAVIGAEGQGPGEFSNPDGLAVTEDSIFVVDAGNGRVQVLTFAGEYARSYPLPADFLGGVAVADDGRLAVPTQGFRQEVLALTFDAAGARTGSVGETVVPPHEMWDIQALKLEIRRGRIPQSLRNMARAVHDPAGGLWLVLQAEGAVHRYDPAGSLQWATALRAPELDSIRAAFFRRNEELSESMSFTVLTYVADAAPHAGKLWLLLNTPAGESSVVLTMDENGGLARRYVLPGLHGARELAIDPAGTFMYLAVPSEASVLRAALLWRSPSATRVPNAPAAARDATTQAKTLLASLESRA